MKSLLKSVNGNIYGLGVYCFKDEEKILYVGSGMMNDRLQSHLYNLKRGLYENTNKDILQNKYNIGELSFEVLHFSENNSEYINGTDAKRKAIQKSLEVLEQFYVNMYKDTICNKVINIKKHSSNTNALTTIKRRNANLGQLNPHNKYSEDLIAEILWLKMNGYKPREIEVFYEGIKANYIGAIGVSKWVHMQPKKPKYIKNKEVNNSTLLAYMFIAD